MRATLFIPIVFIANASVLASGACTRSDRDDSLQSSTGAATTGNPSGAGAGATAQVAGFCEGYKPHIDGSVSSDTSICDSCARLGHGAGTQRGRLATSGEAHACGEPHGAPALADRNSEFYYRSYRYKNRKATATCVEVIVTQYTGRSTSTGLRSAAYGAFDPTNVASNYLGDGGRADVPEHRYSFMVAPLELFDVVITGAEVGSDAAESGASYRLDVLGCGRVLATAITPTSGPPDGGTTVTIKGAGFMTGRPIVFIGSEATAVTPIDDETLTAITQATAAGTYDVSVSTEVEGFPTSTLPQAYTYGAAGSSSGGTSSGGSSGGGSTSSGGSSGKTW